MTKFITVNAINKLPTSKDIEFIKKYLIKHPKAKKIEGFKITIKWI